MKLLFKNVKIAAVKDSLIKDAKDVFSWIDSDFESYGASEPQKTSNETELEVYEINENKTFAQIFTNPEKQCLTQGQILDFVKNHKDKLRTDGYATFFLFKSGSSFFVAALNFDDGGLKARVARFESGDVWGAGSRHRVILPTLSVNTEESYAIDLGDGEFSSVDKDDFDLLNEWKWSAYASGKKENAKTKYAYRREYDKKTKKETTILMHRVILGNVDGLDVDHIDGNGLNNQRSNLRFATKSQNMMNRGANKNNTSGFKGVSYISINRNRCYLGIFDDKNDAAFAYNQAASLYHGEFARLNSIPATSPLDTSSCDTLEIRDSDALTLEKAIKIVKANGYHVVKELTIQEAEQALNCKIKQ